MLLIETADLKTWLGITGDSENAFLARLAAGLDAAARSYLRRNILSAEYTRYLDGLGRKWLYLPEYPVTAIADLRVAMPPWGGVGNDNAFPTAAIWARNSDFIADTLDESEENQGRLTSIRTAWPRGIANIKVQFTAGYAAVPQDLKLALCQFASQIRAARDKGMVTASETLGDYSYQLMSFDKSTDLGDARSILRRYKKKVF